MTTYLSGDDGTRIRNTEVTVRHFNQLELHPHNKRVSQITLELCLVPVFCIIHHVHWLLRFVQRGTWPKNHLPAGNWYDRGLEPHPHRPGMQHLYTKSYFVTNLFTPKSLQWSSVEFIASAETYCSMLLEPTLGIEPRFPEYHTGVLAPVELCGLICLSRYSESNQDLKITNHV